MSEPISTGSSLNDFLTRYDHMAIKAAHQVIASYSTSFSLATRLLGPQVRTDIRNLYAMVRIADEIVDGTAAAAGLSPTEITTTLDDYEQAVLGAVDTRFQTDLVLHAYGISARRCGFNPDHIRAFFASMRRDLHQSSHDPRSLEDYIYGSAEVIGLLCLAAFLVDHLVTPEQQTRLETGARCLGAAFQKINFLRDLAEDSQTLGRAYFPGLDTRELTDTHKDELITDIRRDLSHAHTAIPLLPGTARAGVLAATELFTELTRRLEAVPAAELSRRRVSVPPHTKAVLLARVLRATPRAHSRKEKNR